MTRRRINKHSILTKAEKAKRWRDKNQQHIQRYGVEWRAEHRKELALKERKRYRMLFVSRKMRKKPYAITAEEVALARAAWQAQGGRIKTLPPEIILPDRRIEPKYAYK